MAYPNGAPLPITITVDTTPIVGYGAPTPFVLKSPLPAGAAPGGAARAAAVAALTQVTTPNATDLATALTLVNALKVQVNAIVTALQTPAA